MLVMFGLEGLSRFMRSADAHDEAGLGCPFQVDARNAGVGGPFLPKSVQLMLMMLGLRCPFCSKASS